MLLTVPPLHFCCVPLLLMQFHPQRCYFLQITPVFFRISVLSTFLCLQFFNFSFQFYIRQTKNTVHTHTQITDKIVFRHFSTILENLSLYLIKSKTSFPVKGSQLLPKILSLERKKIKINTTHKDK